MGYIVEHSGNIGVVKIGYRRYFSQSFLLSADRHWDNPMSNHAMQLKHLRRAKRINAGIIDIGDFFCAMQGRYDKRSNKDALRPEHRANDYFDSLINTAEEFFSPYANNFITVGMGNHETEIEKHHEINLTNRLVKRLNEHKNLDQSRHKIYNGQYSGWIVFEFKNENGSQETKKLWYIHGYGGGGPVTKGVIQSNRRAVYLPNADFVVTGHIHEYWNLEIVKLQLDKILNTPKYAVTHEVQEHIQLPTYKDEYSSGSGGWHIQTGKPPKPLGAVWLTFTKTKEDDHIQYSISRAR